MHEACHQIACFAGMNRLSYRWMSDRGYAAFIYQMVAGAGERYWRSIRRAPLEMARARNIAHEIDRAVDEQERNG